MACCLSNAMHSIGQSIKLPECLSIRPTSETPYLHNGARYTHAHNGPPIESGPPRVEWSRD